VSGSVKIVDTTDFSTTNADDIAEWLRGIGRGAK
jgi:hypothetical protein